MQNSNYTSNGNIIVNNAIARIQEENYHAKSFLLWVSARLWTSQKSEVILSFREVQESAQLSSHIRPNKIVDFINTIKEKNRTWDIRDNINSAEFKTLVPIFESIEMSNFTRDNFVRLRYSEKLSEYLNMKKRYCVLPIKVVLESTPTIQNIAIDLLINRYNGKYILTMNRIVNNYGLSSFTHLSKLKAKYFDLVVAKLKEELPDIQYVIKCVGHDRFFVFPGASKLRFRERKMRLMLRQTRIRVKTRIMLRILIMI